MKKHLNLSIPFRMLRDKSPINFFLKKKEKERKGKEEKEHVPIILSSP